MLRSFLQFDFGFLRVFFFVTENIKLGMWMINVDGEKQTVNDVDTWSLTVARGNGQKML